MRYLPKILLYHKKKKASLVQTENICRRRINCYSDYKFVFQNLQRVDVNSTANLFPYNARFTFDGVRNNKTQQR